MTVSPDVTPVAGRWFFDPAEREGLLPGQPDVGGERPGEVLLDVAPQRAMKRLQDKVHAPAGRNRAGVDIRTD